VFNIHQLANKLLLNHLHVYLGIFYQSHPGIVSLAIPLGRHNEYWPWSRSLLGKTGRVLHNSRPCKQDCWHTGLIS